MSRVVHVASFLHPVKHVDINALRAFAFVQLTAETVHAEVYDRLFKTIVDDPAEQAFW